MMRPQVVTFDLFSALIDSRTGGSAALGNLADARGWPVSGPDLYDRWDALNKEAHRQCRHWVPYRQLARDALASTYESLGLDGDAGEDIAVLLGSVGEWPLWPDVRDGLATLRGSYRIGLLSNVDDEVFARTAASALVDHDAALTSERLTAYKPAAAIYRRAAARLPGMIHVATSARDVRGATEAGIPFVRLRRPGHALDPGTGTPVHEVGSLAELPAALAAVLSDRSTDR
jgi:2-haloacid dehalogenase